MVYNYRETGKIGNSFFFFFFFLFVITHDWFLGKIEKLTGEQTNVTVVAA